MDATIIAALITASGVITAAVITASSQARAAQSPNTQPRANRGGCVFAILSIISLLVGIIIGWIFCTMRFVEGRLLRPVLLYCSCMKRDEDVHFVESEWCTGYDAMHEI
jgi:hypothetical protein